MKKEMNNKGFSLVELIIVVAIMVILIAVLAPQYLRYVERARVSSDQNQIVSIIEALQIAATDEQSELTTTESYTVTSAAGSNAVAFSANLQTVLNTRIGILDAATVGGVSMQSTAYTDAALNIQLRYNAGRQVWEVVALNGAGTGDAGTGDVGISGAIIP